MFSLISVPSSLLVFGLEVIKEIIAQSSVEAYRLELTSSDWRELFHVALWTILEKTSSLRSFLGEQTLIR
jgi:hypothetical protein